MDAVYAKCAKPAIHVELQQGLQPFVYWHVTESIQEGYTPEEIGELQEEVEVEALVLESRSIARDRALGYFVSLLDHYLSRQSEPVSVDSALGSLGSDLDKETAYVPFDNFLLDTADIYEYVEEQKQNAGLIGDDFSWHRQPKTSEKLQWNTMFKNSLELTRRSYLDACKRFEHRFTLGSEADVALIKLLSFEMLIEFVSSHKANPVLVPAPPPTVTDIPTTSSFWGQRVGNKRTTTNRILPEFNPAHIIQAGRQFRAACIEHVQAQGASTSRLSDPGKQIEIILSQALNPETNPECLIRYALERYHSIEMPDAKSETTIRSTKDMLSSALRILGTRDGERNITLRIRAHNLRGHINLRLADLKPQHEANYLSRAISDWSASTELDLRQNKIIDVLAKAEIRLESLSKTIKGPSSSTDSNLSKQSFTSETDRHPTASTSAPGKQIAEAQATASATNRSNSAKDGEPGKPREKTILESPFFRSDLVTGLMVDALLALPFPHRALRETLRLPPAAAVAAASQDHVSMLDRFARSHQQTVKALTAENKAQLKAAIKTVSAVLALPDLQQTRDDPSEKILRRTSFRLVLGTLHLMLNEFVKAQTELDLVSNALKPNTRDKLNSQEKKKKGVEKLKASGQTEICHVEDAVEPSKAAADSTSREREKAVRAMETRVQGQALFLLAKTCWMTNKVQEAAKFFRWFVKWYSEQQAYAVQESSDGKIEIELAELDMTWWDKVVVVVQK